LSRKIGKFDVDPVLAYSHFIFEKTAQFLCKPWAVVLWQSDAFEFTMGRWDVRSAEAQITIRLQVDHDPSLRLAQLVGKKAAQSWSYLSYFFFIDGNICRHVAVGHGI
jgi:hypothetical protein